MNKNKPLAVTLFLLMTIFGSSAAFAGLTCQQLFVVKGSLGALGSAKIFDLKSTKTYKESRSDFPGLRPVLEYSAQTGTLIIHLSSLSLDGYRYYKSLLENLPLDVRTVLIGTKDSYDDFVQYSLSQHIRKNDKGEPLDKFLAVENETVAVNETIISKWVQDHMGRLASYTSPTDGKDVIGMVAAGYRFNYQASTSLSNFLGVNILHRISGNHEWGNYTVIGKTAYMVQGPRIDSSLNINDFAYTGVDRVVLLPRPQDSAKNQIGIPHTDEFLIALADDLVLTNVAEYKTYFQSQGKRSALLPSNADLGLDFFTYTNAVIVNSPTQNVIFVPQFGQLPPGTKIFGFEVTADQLQILKNNDEQAMRVYRKHAKGYKVVPVHTPEFTANHFGGPHCATGICAVISNPNTRPGFARDGTTDL